MYFHIIYIVDYLLFSYTVSKLKQREPPSRPKTRVATTLEEEMEQELEEKEQLLKPLMSLMNALYAHDERVQKGWNTL